MSGPKPAIGSKGASTIKQNGTSLPPPVFRFMPLAKNALDRFEPPKSSGHEQNQQPSTSTSNFAQYPVKRVSPPPQKKPKLINDHNSLPEGMLSAHPHEHQQPAQNGNTYQTINSTKFDNNIQSATIIPGRNLQISEVHRSGMHSPSPPTEIELPPNCNLFRIVHNHNGVNREFMIPMTEGSTINDVLNNLPLSFDDIAATVCEAEKNNFGNNPEKPPQRRKYEYVTDEIDLDKEDGTPFLVNPKQYHRIVKRREMKERLMTAGRIPTQRQKYLHESRHRHAIQRMRGEDGRFDKKLQKTTLEPTESGGNQPKAMTVEQGMKYSHFVNIRPAAESGPFSQIPIHHEESHQHQMQGNQSDFKLQNL